MSLNNIHIGTKLFAAFLFVAVFSVGGTVVTLLQQHTQTTYEKMIRTRSIQIEALLQMKSVAVNVVLAVEGLHKDITARRPEKESAVQTVLEGLTTWEEVYRTGVGSTDARRNAVLSTIDIQKNTIVDSALAYFGLEAQRNEISTIEAKHEVLHEAVQALTSSIDQAVSDEEAGLARAQATSAKLSKRTALVTSSVALGAVCIALLFGFLLTRVIARPLRLLRDGVVGVAKGGDIASMPRFTGRDELGDLAGAFTTMVDKLKDSRVDLEIQVQETTTKSSALEHQVVETEKTKAAVLNLLEDIDAEKKKVEQTVVERTKELAEEKARLLASINSLSFGFVIADTHDTIVVKNAALSRILDLTEEPTTTTQIIESFKGVASGLDILTHSCKECVELKKVVELKEISHGKKYLRVFCTPVITKGESAEVIGYVILVEDVTEAKVMERSREEFFAVASHELRTPLTAIRGNADMILSMYADKIVDPDMKEMLQDINGSSVRLIAVVNDFLDASRLEQGKVELKKEDFALTDIVEKVVRDLKGMVEQKGLALTYTPPKEPLKHVFADKNRSEQILLNLVGNAIKFTKQGSITIVVTPQDGFLAVRVIDTGDGISEHNQNLLFRKFQQAGEDMLARDVTQSTGLGLYISKLIISSMGGTIGLEKSELGKGSTFTFTLPTVG